MYATYNDILGNKRILTELLMDHLARETVTRRVPDAWVIDLSSTSGTNG